MLDITIELQNQDKIPRKEIYKIIYKEHWINNTLPMSTITNNSRLCCSEIWLWLQFKIKFEI